MMSSWLRLCTWTAIFGISMTLIYGQAGQGHVSMPGPTEQTGTDFWMGDNVTVSPTSTNRIPLYLALLVAFSGVDTSGSFVAADLALQHVNERDDILPGYELLTSVSDSAVSVA